MIVLAIVINIYPDDILFLLLDFLWKLQCCTPVGSIIAGYGHLVLFIFMTMRQSFVGSTDSMTTMTTRKSCEISIIIHVGMTMAISNWNYQISNDIIENFCYIIMLSLSCRQAAWVLALELNTKGERERRERVSESERKRK